VILWKACVPLRHSALDVDGALDRVNNAPELGEKTVTHQLKD
jgi:hypothetical protein